MRELALYKNCIIIIITVKIFLISLNAIKYYVYYKSLSRIMANYSQVYLGMIYYFGALFVEASTTFRPVIYGP